jgi:hypothetical protein
MLRRAGEEVIDAYDDGTIREQPLTEVRTEKACPPVTTIRVSRCMLKMPVVRNYDPKGPMTRSIASETERKSTGETDNRLTLSRMPSA